MNQTPMDWSNNTRQILEAIKAGEQEAIDLLCFPELCLSGYGCEDTFLSAWLSENARKEINKIALEANQMMVCIGMPIRIEEKTYNGVCVIQNKRILGITLKQNLAKDGVHYEHRWFEEWPPHRTKALAWGDQEVMVGDLTYECKGVSFGFEICEDAWRKIRPAANLVKRKVDLILNPSASHFAMGKSPSREELVKQSTLTYQCVYGYVNLLGNEAGRMIYDGDILFAKEGKLIQRNRRLSLKPFVIQHCEVDFDAPDSQVYQPNDDITEKNEEFAQVSVPTIPVLNCKDFFACNHTAILQV